MLDESCTNGGSADHIQLLASATKGFTGMLGAIAAADGLFNLDEPVAERAIVEGRSDLMKSRINYRHLLTMTSGLRELIDLAGWLDYLPARADYPSVSTLVYSGDPNIFGLALERRLGDEAVVDYLSRRLLQLLGITSLRWPSNLADGHPNLTGSAYVTARDWVKFGKFVRLTMSARWTGPTTLPRAFFEQVFAGNPAHGSYWWLKKPVPVALAATIDANNRSQFSREIRPIIDHAMIPDDFEMAKGAYGQQLYAISSLELTVVRNGPAQRNSFDDVEFLTRPLTGFRR